MKSYNHLWVEILKPSNIELAIRNASKGKRNRKRVRKMLADPSAYVKYYQDFAIHYKHRIKPPKEIYDGICKKKRKIVVPSLDEQILHHMIVNVLSPVIMKGMYEHAYGSIPGRGPVSAKKQIEKWIRNDPKNFKFILKMDIHSFFGSIPHDKLLEHISKRVHDKDFIRLMTEVIYCTEVGLPLGFHTSHWLANWYLQVLDHFIKEELGAIHYVRYMDDMVIFSSNKRKLHKMRIAIEEFLETRLGLELKPNWQVYRFSYIDKSGKERGRDLDFMGYRFYRNRTVLRRAIMYRMTQKAKRLSKKEKPTIYDCRQMLAALGYIEQTNTYGMYLKYIKPYVNFQYMKRRISRYQKNINRKEKQALCGKQLKTQAA